MANSVIDKLADWLPNADNADTNHPQPDDFAGPETSPNVLDGELRRLKSEVRDWSLEPPWVRCIKILASQDINQLVPPGDGTIVGVQAGNPPSIILGGDYSYYISGSVPGQRVQCWMGSGAVLYGTIVNATFPGPGGGNTSIGVVMDAGVLDSSLTEVRIGSWNPDKSFLPFGTNRALDLIFGGTGNTTGQPHGVAGGDLHGSYPDPLVSGIQNVPVTLGAPADKNVLAFDVGSQSLLYNSIAALDPDVTNRIALSNVLGSQGWIKLPIALGGGTNLILQWATQMVTLGNVFGDTFNLNLPLAFPTEGFVAIANNPGLVSAGKYIFAGVNYANPFPTTQSVKIDWTSTAAANAPVEFTVIAIGH